MKGIQHRHYPIRARCGATLQQVAELNSFLDRLDAQKIVTTELLAALLVLREYDPPARLREWCDAAAHRKRDRGEAAMSGVTLWAEKVYIDEFFGERPLKLSKIPIRLFEAARLTLVERDFGDGGIGIRDFYPHGYSIEEIVAQLDYLYRRNAGSACYELRKVDDDDYHELRILQRVLNLVQTKHFGAKPVYYEDIHNAFAEAMHRLTGRGRGILRNRKTLLAQHFLCAFHQLEIGIRGQTLLEPCYLAVDFTRSGDLALSLAVYEQEDGLLQQMELAFEDRPDKSSTASHAFCRPYLITDLSAAKFLDPRELDGNVFGTLYADAVEVARSCGRSIIQRVGRPPLRRWPAVTEITFD